ncbi:NO-inducible flavohemoprotein [Gluconacetobacter azotocaptans]|uniref:nitric oxide dioxygenase n=1 Tax=Gluconacetobacter azotocaptans TaxID=142834 RepID=A0A7W4PEU4_9PROT|nr:NO-inducible flavohemoprotein [Gluconacetobacter azotocaptans]MBB2191143.1 NO-inducible flavohemoprotein [Gluconacetobacter azotocaptans]MBM9402246.1 NO-inducible flavohemoprotein [Gluconacetobacter azotocaptans]GBQ37027.1 flavohemoprotein [Gluconacetobacter azotocaptans DSM 13594]
MASPLDDKTRSILKACVPALEAHGLAITAEMYRRLLVNPEIRDLFNMSHQADGAQPKALALAVLAYARNIDNLGALGGMVERIAEKHVGLNILPEHYPHVADALLGAIAHVLGEAATPEIMDAWGKAYWFLADILIGREGQIYAAHATAPGGWTGWRAFTVRGRTRESETVTSFELIPADGKPIMRHQPGQYLSFRLDIPGHGPQRRNYSISSAPGADAYRISVRRVRGGVVSEWLHDSMQDGTSLLVSAPAGDFTLADPTPTSVVLLSAGVGLTPMISMLGALTTAEQPTPIRYIHGTRSARTEAFGAYIRTLSAPGRVRGDVFYSRQAPAEDEPAAALTCHAGRITPAWLKTQIDGNATYYICGPDDFMRDMVAVLKEAGLAKEQVRYEFFGSADKEILVT